MKNKLVKLPYRDLEIYQQEKGNTITSDTEFLVKTILRQTTGLADSPVEVLELGTGNGIISIMLYLERNKWQITGVEVQIPLFTMALANKKKTGTSIEFMLADIRQISRYLCHKKYDLVIANPPFYIPGKGKMSHNLGKTLSRWEILCNLEEVIKGVKDTLKPAGTAFLLYPANRRYEIELNAANRGLSVKEVVDENSYQKDNNISTKTVDKKYV